MHSRMRIVAEGDDAADAERSVDEIETKAEESVSGLVILGDRETRGCAEPEIVQVSVEGLSEGQTVTVESAFASVGGDFFTGAGEETQQAQPPKPCGRGACTRTRSRRSTPQDTTRAFAHVSETGTCRLPPSHAKSRGQERHR